MTTINNNYSNYSNQAPKQDPNAYAQQYADQNGLTLEEAKAELKSKFGDPSQGAQIPNLNNDDSTSVFSSNDSSANTLNLDDDVKNVTLTDDITSDSKSLLKYILDLFMANNEDNEEADPDEIAQEYADTKGITLEEAKEELKEIGEPQRMAAVA